MSEDLVRENIYDKNGILLIAKGQRFTESIVERLKMFGYYNPKETFDYNTQKDLSTSSVVQEFGERINIRNAHILEYPNKVLNKIIFESKTKPWWIYVNALSNYVDWLYSHSIDVAIISLMMAVELGYNDEELWNIGLGALLHDIGKLLIPKSIIEKPGTLNDTETVFMQQHCELGMSSIETYCLPKECTDIILCHHERLDGSGYPKGIRGDDICLNARIAMIADTVDAITSERPYRKSQEIDTAIKILNDEKEKYSQELVLLLKKLLG